MVDAASLEVGLCGLSGVAAACGVGAGGGVKVVGRGDGEDRWLNAAEYCSEVGGRVGAAAAKLLLLNAGKLWAAKGLVLEVLVLWGWLAPLLEWNTALLRGVEVDVLKEWNEGVDDECARPPPPLAPPVCAEEVLRKSVELRLLCTCHGE